MYGQKLLNIQYFEFHSPFLKMQSRVLGCHQNLVYFGNFFTRLPCFGQIVRFVRVLRSSRWYFRVRSTNEHRDLVLSATGVSPSPAHAAPGAHASVALDSANAPREPPARPPNVIVRVRPREFANLQPSGRLVVRARSKFWLLRHRARGLNCAATHVHIVRRKKYEGSVLLHSVGNFLCRWDVGFVEERSGHVVFRDIDRWDNSA